MTIVTNPRLNVEAIDADPTALDREHAAETSPFAGEHHDQGEPTPLDVLDAGRHRPRYETRVCGRQDRPRDGYFVWDLEEDGPTAWHRWLTDAHNHAGDLNAEDFEDQGDWWATMPHDDADLDARWGLAGVETPEAFALPVGVRRSGMTVEPDEDARACGLA